MKMTRTLSAVRLAGIAAALPLMALAAPTISDLTVIPIPSWGLAIGYTVSGATADDADAPLVVTATGVGTNYTATTLYGDKSCVNGSHYVFWQTSKDGITADVSNGTLRVWYPLRYCVIDLGAAAVKDEIAKAVLSVAEGTEINLSAENPVLTTAETKPGLTYQLYEGAMLSDLKAGDSTVGDGKAWTPTLSVTGGTSGFYTIQVTK